MNILSLIGALSMLLLPSSSAGVAEKFQFPVSASSRVLGYAPLWVADKKGFFEREGLHVEVSVTRGTPPSLRALVAESIHAALAGNDGVIALVEKGIEDLAIIAGGSKSTHMIIGKKHIKKYEDLRGATIGASTLTSGTAFLLRRVLKANGLEYPKDYSLVNVGGSGPSLIAIASGNVAAGILSVPLNFRARHLGLSVIGKVTDVFPNYLLSSFSVRRRWAQDHRAEVVKFLKALLKARKWLEENRNDAAAFLANELKLKPVLARQGLDYYLDHRAWEPDLGVNLEGLKAVLKVYSEQADAPGPLENPEKYLDLSYLKTALKELGGQ
jgi:ABC-type nitrate/sulfonate/bicarbonate transport system substrate-binding protein